MLLVTYTVNVHCNDGVDESTLEELDYPTSLEVGSKLYHFFKDRLDLEIKLAVDDGLYTEVWQP